MVALPSRTPHTDFGLSEDSTKETCAAIVAKLQGSGISNSLVTVGDSEELTNEIHSQAKHGVISALGKDDPSVSVINSFFDNIENPFAHLNTEWKIFQPKIWSG